MEAQIADLSFEDKRVFLDKEQVVPLPRQAVEALRAIHGISGELVHVFPHRDDRTKPMTDASLRQALNQLGWGGKYSPHATRTTGSTRLNEMGFSPDWIERQLAHAEPNAVRRTYQHADCLADRTKMMQHWADMLDAWKAGAKVLPLRATATALAFDQEASPCGRCETAYPLDRLS